MEETRRGVNEGKDDDGVRLWVKYEAIALPWLRILDVRKSSRSDPDPERLLALRGLADEEKSMTEEDFFG